MSTFGPTHIDDRMLARVVALMPADFATKDVSQHAEMLAAHPVHRDERNWHAHVGGALSSARNSLGIQETQKGTSRGSRWHRMTLANADVGRPAVIPPPPPASVAMSQPPVGDGQHALDLGPQYAGDNRLAAKMRRHQSWYRANVLRVPFGTGPKSTDLNLYGNMLTVADAERGANFLTPGIFAVAKRRLAEGMGTVEPFRLLRNMLSSQPMCFNLFGPLVDDLDLATRLMAELRPGEVAKVTAVKLEFAPQPSGAYLADRTAFDAYVEWVTPTGGKAFMGFETKLTEPFSQTREYDGQAYRRWMTDGSPWLPEAAGAVTNIRHNQLWRDHLLAVAHLRQTGAAWEAGRLAVVRHPLDVEGAETVVRYRQLLRPDDNTFLDLTLEQVVEAWGRAVRSEGERAWLQAFRLRYLDLGAEACADQCLAGGN
ncbi:MAG: PGN_0703 family putative restriction endonuclease [Myxococcota bacterium]